MVTCMAPFLCNMRGSSFYYSVEDGHCKKFSVFMKARRFVLNGILSRFNITLTGKPVRRCLQHQGVLQNVYFILQMDGMPQLYGYCGAKTPITEYFRRRSALLGKEITRFGSWNGTLFPMPSSYTFSSSELLKAP